MYEVRRQGRRLTEGSLRVVVSPTTVVVVSSVTVVVVIASIAVVVVVVASVLSIITTIPTVAVAAKPIVLGARVEISNQMVGLFGRLT